MMPLRVAVIGAGAAGLAALRHLAANPAKFSPVGFEMTSHVSGTWVYTDRIGTDELGLPLHSSMYYNLTTNLPKEVMAFPGFPFSKDLPSFVTHQEVRKYLEDYASHYKLDQHIKFNTRVTRVAPKTHEEGQQHWEVTVSDVLQPDSPATSHQFDSVMVCNGHYALPLMPDLPGLDTFSGLVLHSHDYRKPQTFHNLTVAILGAQASGQDMALDISTVAKQVYLCHNKNMLETPLSANVQQKVGIKEVRPTSIVLNNDQELNIDALVFCTGYQYDFPFLSPECRFDLTDERVTPLYKHVIDTRYPTLATIGITKKVVPFPQFHCQVLFFLAALTGDIVLPSREEMEKDTEKDFHWRLSEGMPTRYAHSMADLQWEYNNELAALAGFPPIMPVIETLYNRIHETRATNLPGYKKHNYELVSDEEYKTLS